MLFPPLWYVLELVCCQVNIEDVASCLWSCVRASEPAGCDGILGDFSLNLHWPMRDRAETWADQSELAQHPLVTRCQWAASQGPYVCVKIFCSQSESPETEPCHLILMKSRSSWVRRISRHSQSVRASYLRVRAVLSALSAVMPRLTGNDSDEWQQTSLWSSSIVLS